MLDLKAYGLDPKSKKARLLRVGIAIQSSWKAEARKYGLKRTLQAYKRGVQIRNITQNTVFVSLSGTVPLLVEKGIAPHDMRTYLLKTRNPMSSPIRKVKSGKRKGQPYRYIMFRRTVEDIKTYGFKGAYSQAKQMKYTINQTNGRLLYGSKFSSGASKHYINKTGIRSVSGALSGMIRLTATTTGGATQGANSTYAVFRTVSTKRPEAWQHGGLKPAMIHRKVLRKVPQIVQGAGI